MDRKIPLGLSFDDVLLVPQKSEIESRSQVDLTTTLVPGIDLLVPIVATNMVDVTWVEMAITMAKLGGIGVIHRFTTPQVEAEAVAAVKKAGQRVVAAIGMRDGTFGRAEMCHRAGADAFLFDLPHAHMTKALRLVGEIKTKFKLPLIAGTVATEEGAYDLFMAGADAIKVGIGAGSICTTRIQTGCGVPQITAVMAAAAAKKKFKNKSVISDAGIRTSGDIVKALAAGADAVICGNFLSGTDEAPGEIIEKDGRFYKEYEGSTSLSEKEKQKEIEAGLPKHFVIHVEGVSGLVPYKGSVVGVIEQACAGIRSGFSYCGARNIRELHKKARFIQVTTAGQVESRAHTIEVV